VALQIIVREDLQSLSGLSDETSDVETLSKPRACTCYSGTGQVRPVKLSQAAKEFATDNAAHQPAC
jgi:hypothetical protein